jgi:hypothetical protein
MNLNLARLTQRDVTLSTAARLSQVFHHGGGARTAAPKPAEQNLPHVDRKLS